MSRTASPLLLLACWVAGSGCSLAARGPSTDITPTGAPACTRSVTLPMIDTIAAISLAAVAVSLSQDPCDENDILVTCGVKAGADATGIVGATVGAAVYGGFAIYGYTKVARCNRAVDEYENGHGRTGGDELSLDEIVAAGAGTTLAAPPPDPAPQHPPRIGELGGFCNPNDTCDEPFVCNRDTHRCERADE